MRAVLVLVVLAAFMVGSIALAGPEVKQIQGKVLFACPRGAAVKVHSDSATLMLWVNPNCPRREALATQIKALKAGDCVKAEYVALDGKNYLTKLEPLPRPGG